MKWKWFTLCLASGLMVVNEAHAGTRLLYVGGYTQGDANGIFLYAFDDTSGTLTDLKTSVRGNSPTFLAVSSDQRFLYAAHEGIEPGKKSVEISAFRIGEKGALHLLNQVTTNGRNACHVTLSPDGKTAAAANYTDGNVTLFTVLPDGALSPLTQQLQHQGRGALSGRQASAHAHSAQFDSTGTHLFVADLGTDQLHIYRRSENGASWVPDDQPFVQLLPGSGPRHFAFSADGRFIYLINELASTITVLTSVGGKWQAIQTIRTLPEGFAGKSFAADIHLSNDNRFLYGSNRGHDSIVVFMRDPVTGTLKIVQTVSVEGRCPRNFALDPSGAFLLVANQESNDITVFHVDSVTGKLSFNGCKIPAKAPACLQFLHGASRRSLR